MTSVIMFSVIMVSVVAPTAEIKHLRRNSFSKSNQIESKEKIILFFQFQFSLIRPETVKTMSQLLIEKLHQLDLWLNLLVTISSKKILTLIKNNLKVHLL